MTGNELLRFCYYQNLADRSLMVVSREGFARAGPDGGTGREMVAAESAQGRDGVTLERPGDGTAPPAARPDRDQKAQEAADAVAAAGAAGVETGLPRSSVSSVPSSSLAYDSVRQLVCELIDRIPNSDVRDVLRLRYLLSLPFGEIAERLHFSRRYVVTLHRRGLAEFEKLLASGL